MVGGGEAEFAASGARGRQAGTAQECDAGKRNREDSGDFARVLQVRHEFFGVTVNGRLSCPDDWKMTVKIETPATGSPAVGVAGKEARGRPAAQPWR
jgi:hypothetical protein